MRLMATGVYPGSFDPVTNGHLDIIERASRLCDKLIVAVLVNRNKEPMFTLDERVALLKTVLKNRQDIEIMSFSGLLVDFMHETGSRVIIKGLRPVSDFDYEFQMAQVNRHQAPEIETLFMVSDINYSFVSSQWVKELAKNGGKIDGLVPECIIAKILEKANPDKLSSLK